MAVVGRVQKKKNSETNFNHQSIMVSSALRSSTFFPASLQSAARKWPSVAGRLAAAAARKGKQTNGGAANRFRFVLRSSSLLPISLPACAGSRLSMRTFLLFLTPFFLH